MAKAILRKKKNRAGGIRLPDFRSFLVLVKKKKTNPREGLRWAQLKLAAHSGINQQWL